jgi:hypothetical protein
MGLQARLMSQALRTVTAATARAAVIFINQLPTVANAPRGLDQHHVHGDPAVRVHGHHVPASSRDRCLHDLPPLFAREVASPFCSVASCWRTSPI